MNLEELRSRSFASVRGITTSKSCPVCEPGRLPAASSIRPSWARRPSSDRINASRSWSRRSFQKDSPEGHSSIARVMPVAASDSMCETTGFSRHDFWPGISRVRTSRSRHATSQRYLRSDWNRSMSRCSWASSIACRIPLRAFVVCQTRREESFSYGGPRSEES